MAWQLARPTLCVQELERSEAHPACHMHVIVASHDSSLLRLLALVANAGLSQVASPTPPPQPRYTALAMCVHCTQPRRFQDSPRQAHSLRGTYMPCVQRNAAHAVALCLPCLPASRITNRHRSPYPLDLTRAHVCHHVHVTVCRTGCSAPQARQARWTPRHPAPTQRQRQHSRPASTGTAAGRLHAAAGCHHLHRPCPSRPQPEAA